MRTYSPLQVPCKGSPERPQGPRGAAFHPSLRPWSGTRVLAAWPPGLWRPRVSVVRQGARPPRPFPVPSPARAEFGKCRGPRSTLHQRPAGCVGREALRKTGRPRDARGAGARVLDAGRGVRRGARCSPVKAPTAFMMSSALRKSVIDILQLFELAEQVRKD